LLPCEPLDVSVGDEAVVFVDVDANGMFDNDEQYEAVVSGTDLDGNAEDIAIKVFAWEDLVDNDPLVSSSCCAGDSTIYHNVTSIF